MLTSLNNGVRDAYGTTSSNMQRRNQPMSLSVNATVKSSQEASAFKYIQPIQGILTKENRRAEASELLRNKLFQDADRQKQIEQNQTSQGFQTTFINLRGDD